MLDIKRSESQLIQMSVGAGKPKSLNRIDKTGKG